MSELKKSIEDLQQRMSEGKQFQDTIENQLKAERKQHQEALDAHAEIVNKLEK